MQIAARGIAKIPEWRLRASLLQFIAHNFDCEVLDTPIQRFLMRIVCVFYWLISLMFYVRFFFLTYVITYIFSIDYRVSLNIRHNTWSQRLIIVSYRLRSHYFLFNYYLFINIIVSELQILNRALYRVIEFRDNRIVWTVNFILLSMRYTSIILLQKRVFNRFEYIYIKDLNFLYIHVDNRKYTSVNFSLLC